MANPFLNATDLITSIKRRALLPTSQSTFTDNDFLAFANEEISMGMLPLIMSMHEEYYVTTQNVQLVGNQANYPIPYRAVGNKLRDLYFQDENGNLREMTRVSPDDRAFYGVRSDINFFYKFFLQGSEIFTIPTVSASPIGSLLFVYYLKPNQIVTSDRVCTVTSITPTVITADTTLNSSTLTNVSDTTKLLVGATITGNGIPTNVTVTITAVTPSVTISAPANATASANSLSVNTTTVGVSSVPTNITTGSLIDVLQPVPGFKTRGFDVPVGAANPSQNYLLFNTADLPLNAVTLPPPVMPFNNTLGLFVGDYICSAQECFIPQIPEELHPLLAQRVAARCLESLGDSAGLQAANTKIMEMEKAAGYLVDNRSEGSPQKLVNLRGLLRNSRVRRRGRW